MQLFFDELVIGVAPAHTQGAANVLLADLLASDVRHEVDELV